MPYQNVSTNIPTRFELHASATSATECFEKIWIEKIWQPTEVMKLYVHILDSIQVYKHILMFQTSLKIPLKIFSTKRHVNNVFLTK